MPAIVPLLTIKSLLNIDTYVNDYGNGCKGGKKPHASITSQIGGLSREKEQRASHDLGESTPSDRHPELTRGLTGPGLWTH
uniref:Uncharacterized protein n=1 Tax=Thermogemmatispora argillosa TaxID=2045280 RepID=A0A455T8J3_9CHLR|nr:hypothetical protein KTA_39970 [Thermogemmatispora argillosa]